MKASLLSASLVSLTGALFVAAWMLARSAEPAPGPETGRPLLVELFTSEGCSNCPQADRFLEQLDQQPVPGAEMIVLSEHVDYWNQAGWKDPYSAHSFSARQIAYARRFGFNEIYTPQVVVDGTSEFVASDADLAGKAFHAALAVPKIPVHLSSIPIDDSTTLHVRVETGSLTPSFGLQEAGVYLAIALNRAKTHIAGGENAGRTLTHVSVATVLQKVGALTPQHSFSQNVQMKLGSELELHNLRLIAFVQEDHQGRVIGAALLPISSK